MTPRFRNLPDGTDPESIRGRHITELLLPTLTLRESALGHNLDLFARWCARHDVSHAPHAKTHMSPELSARQLEHGAWALTAASVSQARALREFGAARVLVANEVADVPGLAQLRRCLNDPSFEVLTLVDSVELVAHMDRQLTHDGEPRRLAVLIELGIDGGRSGARTLATARAVAQAVGASRSLRLAGVECFEGVAGSVRDQRTLDEVDGVLSRLGELAVTLDRDGYFESSEQIVISAGGSLFFDRLPLAVRRLPQLTRPVRAVVRAGGYLVHDYEPLAGASPLDSHAGDPLGALRAALELWATVLSTPEPELAIAGFGKRDAGMDIAAPTVLGRRRGATAREEPATGLRVDRLNDQHAYVVGSTALRVGDVLRLGVTHACTSFDKWPLIPVLDDDDVVIGTVGTRF